MLKQREIVRHSSFNLRRKILIACLGGLILFRSASRFSLKARRSRRDFLPCTKKRDDVVLYNLQEFKSGRN